MVVVIVETIILCIKYINFSSIMCRPHNWVRSIQYERKYAYIYDKGDDEIPIVNFKPMSANLTWTILS